MRKKIKFFSSKAQALSELAIFGAIVIMLLGILISYGMRFNYQQQVSQEAFRKAMGMASMTNIQGAPDFDIPGAPTSTSYAILRNRHIPDPANPWGVGSTAPFESHASVTRNYKSYYTADIAMELPELRIDIDGTEYAYKTASMRYAVGIKERFEEIFGVGNVEKIFGPDENPFFNFGVYRITDSVGGHIFDYDTAVRECRNMWIPQACLAQCTDSISPTGAFMGLVGGLLSGGNPNIGAIVDSLGLSCISCVLPLGGLIAPWPSFCDGLWQDAETGIWHTPELDRMFYNGDENLLVQYYAPDAKSLGLQPSYTQVITQNNEIRRVENEGTITTTDVRDWSFDTTRNIIVNKNFEPLVSGFSGPLEPKKTETNSCIGEGC